MSDELGRQPLLGQLKDTAKDKPIAVWLDAECDMLLENWLLGQGCSIGRLCHCLDRNEKSVTTKLWKLVVNYGPDYVPKDRTSRHRLIWLKREIDALKTARAFVGTHAGTGRRVPTPATLAAVLMRTTEEVAAKWHTPPTNTGFGL